MLTNIGYHGDKEPCLQSWRWWTEGSSHWTSSQDMVCLQFRCSHWSGSEVNRWVTWTRFYEAILLWHRLLVLPVFKHTCVFFSVAIKIKPAFLVSVAGFLCGPFLKTPPSVSMISPVSFSLMVLVCQHWMFLFGSGWLMLIKVIQNENSWIKLKQ